MSEDGELSDEVATVIEDERSEPPPEVILSPVNEAPEAAPETAVLPEEPKAKTGESPEPLDAAPVEDRQSKENVDIIAQAPQEKTRANETVEPSVNMARILPGKGLSFIQPADALKIGLAMLTAAAALVVFWIKKK